MHGAQLARLLLMLECSVVLLEWVVNGMRAIIGPSTATLLSIIAANSSTRSQNRAAQTQARISDIAPRAPAAKERRKG